MAETLRDKFSFACAAQLSDATKQVTGFMQGYVAAYEKQHGEIKFAPAPPVTGEAARG